MATDFRHEIEKNTSATIRITPQH